MYYDESNIGPRLSANLNSLACHCSTLSGYCRGVRRVHNVHTKISRPVWMQAAYTRRCCCGLSVCLVSLLYPTIFLVLIYDFLLRIGHPERAMCNCQSSLKRGATRSHVGLLTAECTFICTEGKLQQTTNLSPDWQCNSEPFLKQVEPTALTSLPPIVIALAGLPYYFVHFENANVWQALISAGFCEVVFLVTLLSSVQA